MSADVDPLLPLIAPGSVGAEIGTKEGHSALALFRHGVRFLYLIDPWEKYPEYREAAGDPDGYWDGVYRQAMDRLSPFAGRHSHLRMRSADAARFVPPILDFVWIDGNHQYEFVKADLEAYWPKIKPGGLLCGHDYCNSPPTCGVKDAVDDWVRGMGLALGTEPPCWWVRKGA